MICAVVVSYDVFSFHDVIIVIVYIYINIFAQRAASWNSYNQVREVAKFTYATKSTSC